MLVLSRRTGESVVIGDDVVVTVLDVKGDGGVRLGIDAPRSTRVHRAEVYAAVKAANADASRAAAEPTRPAVEQLLSLASRTTRPGQEVGGEQGPGAPGGRGGTPAGPGGRPGGETRAGD